MSPDRVVYSFVIGWVVLILVVILLDWLGNPDRGGFRPKGERPPREFRLRRRERRRAKLEEDAAVRATLRDAYGASSLRLTWTRALENAVREADDALVVPEGATRDDVLEVSSAEVITADYTAAVGDPLPNLDEAEVSSEPEPEPAPEAEPGTAAEAEAEREGDAPAVGWTVGADPLVPTRTGRPPSATTVRARAWKNHGDGGWGADNRERVRAGKPPKRRNPVTGSSEMARVDVDTGTASWPDPPVDPFELDS